MKKVITALCLAAAASWVMSVNAQSGSMYDKQQKSSKDEKTVTLTGCLEEGLMANTFTLKNVSGMPSSWANGEGTSGTSGSGTSGEMQGTSGTMLEVMLVPTSGVDLKAHVGHKVEVTGLPSDMMKDKDPMGTSGSAAGQSGSTGTSGSMEHRVKVQTLKHIADSCTGF